MVGLSQKEIARQSFKQYFSENTGHHVDLENPKTKAESEISEELLLDCIWFHSFTHPLTHLSNSYSAVTFIGSISCGSRQPLERSERVRKERSKRRERSNTRTLDLRFEIFYRYVRAHAHIHTQFFFCLFHAAYSGDFCP